MRQRLTLALVWAVAILAAAPVRAAGGAALELQNAVTDVAERVRPSVVSITAEQEQPSIAMPLPQGVPTPRFGLAGVPG